MRKAPLILIIDDTKLNIMVLGDMLKKHNYQVVAVHSGEEALALAEKRRPDLILLDIMMPGMDGFEVCGRLKKKDSTKEMPVIFISALQKVENKVMAFECGGVDYITKPFQEQEVMARIETHLELKRVKETLQEHNKWLKALFENATEPIFLFGKTFSVVDMNKQAEKIFKYKIEEIKGQHIDEVLDRGKPNTADRQATERILAGNSVETEGTRYDKSGNPVECLIRGIPIIIDGDLSGGYAMYVDITKQKALEEKLTFLSFHDQLTGLYNRTYFEEELARLDTERQLPISIIMGDANDLKLVNDTYGHYEGDKLLVQIVKALQKSCRKEDIIARWGGDEFVILLPQTPQKGADVICSRIRQACKEAGNKPVPLSIALGSAVKESSNQDIHEVLKIAEDRMYREKGVMRSRINLNRMK